MKRREILAASTGLAITTIAAPTLALPRRTQTGMAQGKTVQLDRDLSGYYVTPIGTTTRPLSAVIVIMEAFGLNDYVKGVCDRLAKAGYAALAPDFYHGTIVQYGNLPGAIAKLKSLQDETVMAELGKGIAFLAQQKNVIPNQVGVVGFCMGGRFTFLANAAHSEHVKAAVSYYGGGIAAFPDALGRPALLDRVGTMQAPIMLMYGAKDQMIAAEEHQRVAAALSEAKKSYSINLFANAGHGFDSDRRDSYEPAAAEEAWEMTLRFFDRHLKNRPAAVAS